MHRGAVDGVEGNTAGGGTGGHVTCRDFGDCYRRISGEDELRTAEGQDTAEAEFFTSGYVIGGGSRNL